MKSWTNAIALFLIATFIITNCKNADSTAATELTEERTTRAVQILDSISLPVTIDLTQTLSVADTTIRVLNDFFFKMEKRYQAYPVEAYLKPVIDQLEDASNLYLTFICSDGYSASMPYAVFQKQEAFLAFNDMDHAENWPDSLKKRFTPYYMVWPAIEYADKEFVWPYGLFQVRVSRFAEEFGPAFPKDKHAEKGFDLFRSYCLKCHSINRIGGAMGPEFNEPKNITEYWSKENIWQFAKDPTSFRYNSKMPAVTDLTREEFEEIYAYLLAMKKESTLSQSTSQ